MRTRRAPFKIATWVRRCGIELQRLPRHACKIVKFAHRLAILRGRLLAETAVKAKRIALDKQIIQQILIKLPGTDRRHPCVRVYQSRNPPKKFCP